MLPSEIPLIACCNNCSNCVPFLYKRGAFHKTAMCHVRICMFRLNHTTCLKTRISGGIKMSPLIISLEIYYNFTIICPYCSTLSLVACSPSLKPTTITSFTGSWFSSMLNVPVMPGKSFVAARASFIATGSVLPARFIASATK